jgi:hypothetical protein
MWEKEILEDREVVDEKLCCSGYLNAINIPDIVQNVLLLIMLIFSQGIEE